MTRWSERQRAMLREIGVRVWSNEAAPGIAAGVETETDTEPPGGAELEAGADRIEPERARAGRPALPSGHGAGGASADRDRAAMPARAPADAAPATSTPADAAARAAAIAAMEWDTLRDSAAVCTACRLCEGRTHSVFASGAAPAAWLVVGDPPSAHDDRAGVPLAGEAGSLLDNMLHAASVSRDPASASATRACVTPIVKCRPPGDRSAEPDEIAACKPYLLRQLQLVEPQVVVSMGRFAAQGLLRSIEPIGKLRGRLHDVHGVPTVVTFQPAHLLRHPADKAKAWDDLCLAVAAAEGRRPS